MANRESSRAFIRADVSPPEQRARNFRLSARSLALGSLSGQRSAACSVSPSYACPFMAAAGLTLCNWLYRSFVLPELHPKERRRPFDLRIFLR